VFISFMTLSARETIEKWQHERDAYLNKLGDRTRTFCLGTVVLVWGIFSEKGDKIDIVHSRRSKGALLCIALSAVVVVALELVECAWAYLYRRKLAGEPVWKGIKFDKWEATVRFLRIGLGALTVLALCVVLACLVAKSAFGQALNQYPFPGDWCGTDNGNVSSSTCVDISNAASPVTISINLNGINDNNNISCQEDTLILEGTLTATCTTLSVSFGINVTAGMANDEVKLLLTNNTDGSQVTRTLTLQPN
jgi:hypothetical protein